MRKTNASTQYYSRPMKKKTNHNLRQLVLLRNGESEWNRENLFAGWTDVDLSDRGIKEGKEAGRTLRKYGIIFDVAFTSVLKRSIRTLWLLLDEMNLMWIPVHRDWRLNERHYGALQGMNKADETNKFGKTQVKLWQRSYEIRPPALEIDDPRHPRHDIRYKELLQGEIPDTECLKDTLTRFLPCWYNRIAPLVRSGKRVLIVAHGNSLRGLVKHLDGVSNTDIVELNIPSGVPLIYQLDKDLKPIHHYYLDDTEQMLAGKYTVVSPTSPKN